MRLQIISIGKVKQDFIRSGEQEYLKRFPAAWKISFLELGPEEGANDVETKRREGEKILKALPERSFVAALDERGKQFGSEELAELIRAKMVSGTSSMSLIIGGAFGLDDLVRKRADLILSLSRLTFPYQLARLIVVEQMYRAVSVINGLPYHK